LNLKESLGSIRDATRFAVLLEKASYAKQPKRPAERARMAKHASFFGNYQAIDRATDEVRRQFPYDALHIFRGELKNNEKQYKHHPWDRADVKVENVDFPQGQIQRNLVQFKDKKGKFPWGKMRVRGICAMFESLSHGIAKGPKPGPLHIDLFCVARPGAQAVTQPVEGSKSTIDWGIQHGPLKYGGKRLMFEVLKYAKRQGIEWVELVTVPAPDVRCFYQSMGFRCVGHGTDLKRRLFSPKDLGLSENQFEVEGKFIYPEFQYLGRRGAMVLNLAGWNGNKLPVHWGSAAVNMPIRDKGACIQCRVAKDPSVATKAPAKETAKLAAVASSTVMTRARKAAKRKEAKAAGMTNGSEAAANRKEAKAAEKEEHIMTNGRNNCYSWMNDG
jgi:hypothetical protein